MGDGFPRHAIAASVTLIQPRATTVLTTGRGMPVARTAETLDLDVFFILSIAAAPVDGVSNLGGAIGAPTIGATSPAAQATGARPRGTSTTAQRGCTATSTRGGIGGIGRSFISCPLRTDCIVADVSRPVRQPIVITEPTSLLGVEAVAGLGLSPAAACSSTLTLTVTTAAVIRTGVGGVGPASP